MMIAYFCNYYTGVMQYMYYVVSFLLHICSLGGGGGGVDKEHE